MRLRNQQDGYEVVQHHDSLYEVGARQAKYHARVFADDDGDLGRPLFDRLGDRTGMRWWPARLGMSEGGGAVTTPGRSTRQETRQIDAWAPVFAAVTTSSSSTAPSNAEGVLTGGGGASGGQGGGGATGPKGPAGSGAVFASGSPDAVVGGDIGPSPIGPGGKVTPGKRPKRYVINDPWAPGGGIRSMFGGIPGFGRFQNIGGATHGSSAFGLYGVNLGGFARFYQPKQVYKNSNPLARSDGSAGGTGEGGDAGPGGAGGEPTSGPSFSAVAPIRSTTGEIDKRFYQISHYVPPEDSPRPGGASVLAVVGTEEFSQENVAMWAERRIIVPGHAGPGIMGTQFCDLGPTGQIAKGSPPDIGGRQAMPQTMMRIVRMPGGVSRIGNSAGNSIAWNLGPAEQGGYAGFGLCWGQLQTGAAPSSKSPPTVTPRADVRVQGQTDKRDRDTARVKQATGTKPGAYAEAMGNLQAQRSVKGRLGDLRSGVETQRNARGAASGGAGVAVAAAEGGGPFSVGYVNDRHKLGVDKDGNPINPLHLITEALFERNEEEDGPLDFSRLPYPGGEVYDQLAEVFLSWDDSTEKWRWWTTCLTSGGSSDDDGDKSDPPPPITPDPTPPPGGGEPRDPTTPSGGGGPFGTGRPSVPVPFPDGFPGRPRTGGGTTNIKSIRARSQRGSVRDKTETFHGSTAFASVLGRPQSMAEGALELRFSRIHDQVTRLDQTRATPSVIRMEAWGANGNGTWAYTQRPEQGRNYGGSASGGWLYMPPEVDMYDYRAGGTPPAAVSLSTSYVAHAPGSYTAWGYPDTATGDMRACSYRAGYNTTDTSWELSGLTGTTWSPVIRATKTEVFGAAPSTAPADGDIQNNEVALYVNDTDETIHAKGKDGDGDVIDVRLGQMICLQSNLDINQRFNVENYHGGLNAIGTAQAISSGSPPTDPVMGAGKMILLVNAGTDIVGDITITGTSVDRNTGTETPSDTDTITLAGVSTDGSTTDAEGNTVFDWTRAYITSKWFTGTVALSTTTVDISDMDIYEVAFEQVNDNPNSVIETFDVTCKTTNAGAWGYWYLYKLTVSGDEVAIATISELAVTDAQTTKADQSWRRREGNLDVAVDGSSDGIFMQQILGPTNQTYLEDVNTKIWIRQ